MPEISGSWSKNHVSYVFRQYYSYITDTQCKRVGTQCWVYGAIMFTEAMLCIKNGKELFERTQAINIIVWLLIQMIVSILVVYGCVLWHRYFQTEESEISRENSPIKEPKNLRSFSNVKGKLFQGIFFSYWIVIYVMFFR